MATDHKMFVSEFISDKLKGFFFHSIEQYFHGNLWKMFALFLLQKCKRQLLRVPFQPTHPQNIHNSCMCSMPMFIEMPSKVTFIRVQTPQIPCSKILKPTNF